MFIASNQFDKETNNIARLLIETEYARYFNRIESQDGKPYIFNTGTTSVTYGNENGYILGICDTSRKIDGVNLSVFCPCMVTNDGSYSFNPLIFKNIIFYGAIEEDRPFYRLYLKMYFNKKNSVRNKVLTIKHLSKEKIFDIITMLNLAADKIDLDYFKFEELDSPFLYTNEAVLVQKLISGMRYKIYERYTNRPGRDDFFDLIKGIMNIPKNEYFKELIKSSMKSDSISTESTIYFQSKLGSNRDEKEISSVTLSHDSGWTKFPKPNDNIEQGNFNIDLFLVDVIRKFNKYEYLLSELKMKPNELPNKWEIQDSKDLLSLMKAILKEKLGLNDNYNGWHNDSKLKEIEKDLRTKVHHFGFLCKVENVYFSKGKLMANLFRRYPTASSIPQYFENNNWLKSVIFIPICYSDNIEEFFLLDDEAYGIFKELKNSGLVK